MGEMPERRMEAWMGGAFPWCVVLIPILAAPTAALLVWFMRAFAPTRLTLTGAAIGALSGGVGAMAYAMYCPTDSVAFVTTWYALAIAVCAALGAVWDRSCCAGRGLWRRARCKRAAAALRVGPDRVERCSASRRARNAGRSQAAKRRSLGQLVVMNEIGARALHPALRRRTTSSSGNALTPLWDFHAQRSEAGKLSSPD